MADKPRYPQIPSTVWWGVRSLLNRTPKAIFDERLLSIELNVQKTAARQYITELKAVGILDDQGKATPLALKWRIDSSYAEAVEELVARNYPESLRTVAPPSEGDRQKATTWFLQEGLGQGSAGNKAATYFLIGSVTPNEAPNRSATGNGQGEKSGSRRGRSEQTKATSGGAATVTRRARPSTAQSNQNIRPARPPEILPLNINVQIHISADAGAEQIESIFSAMKRYLYDNEGD